MRIHSYKISLGYKLAYVSLAIIAMLLHSGVLAGKPRPNLLVYYTNLSNLLCLAVFCVIVVYMVGTKHGWESAGLAQLKGMCTMVILVTFIIYHFILRPMITENIDMLTGDMEEFGNMDAPGNILVHYIIPLMTLADWALFDEKGKFRWYSPLLWSLALAAYLAFTLIRAAAAGEIGDTGSRFPYPFMDVDALGGPAVAMNCAMIVCAFIALGYAYYGVDHLLGRKQKSVGE